MIILKGTEFSGTFYENSEDFSYIVKPKFYPDGTLFKNIELNKNEDNISIHRIIWQYEDNKELFLLYSLCKKYEPEILEIPYLPNARMDRIENENDIYTLKYFSEIINSLNISWILTIDPHNYDICKVLFNNLYIVTPELYIKAAIEKFKTDNDFTLYFPDEGAYKRYSKLDLGKTNCYSKAFGVKERNWQTGKIEKLNIIGEKNIQNKDILIIDDICSKGGTAFYSAKTLKEAGAKNIYLYVTHCENTIEQGKLLSLDSPIEHIYTTDSYIKILNVKSDKLTVVPYNEKNFRKGALIW